MIRMQRRASVFSRRRLGGVRFSLPRGSRSVQPHAGGRSPCVLVHKQPTSQRAPRARRRGLVPRVSSPCVSGAQPTTSPPAARRAPRIQQNVDRGERRHRRISTRTPPFRDGPQAARGRADVPGVHEVTRFWPRGRAGLDREAGRRPPPPLLRRPSRGGHRGRACVVFGVSARRRRPRRWRSTRAAASDGTGRPRSCSRPTRTRSGGARCTSW